MSQPTDPIGSIGWTERTEGVLTARECLTLARPLLRGELSILAAVSRSARASSGNPRLGFKPEFARLLRAEAKQVPRGRAWYLHRFAMSDLSIRLAPFPD